MRYSAYAEEDAAVGGISVRSCGHIFARHGRQIHRPSGRPDYLLLYIARGSETFFLPDEILAPEGSFVLFRPGEPQIHICRCEKPAEFYYIHFTAPADFDLFGLESSRVWRTPPSPGICGIFEDIMDELQMKRPFSASVSTCRMMEILFRLKRLTGELTPRGGEYADRIAYVIRIMNREMDQPHTLTDYARMCGMSKYHFLRVFESVTGMPPMEYRSRRRIEYARELLEETNLTVSEIGAKLGYASASYFCDAFKRHTGCSPSEYRRSGHM